MNLSWKVVASAPIFAKYADRGAYLIDLKDVYCPDGKCSVLHGNVYMYADSNHLTNVYEATLTDIVYERAFAAGWDPKGITRKYAIRLANSHNVLTVKSSSAACGRGLCCAL